MKRRNKKAVALEYGKEAQPTVVVAAEGDVAEDLVEAAVARNIPVFKDARLQSALSDLDIGDAIPETLYVSVAVALSWAFWLRGDEPF
jgi:flagellar biosynthesis protein